MDKNIPQFLCVSLQKYYQESLAILCCQSDIKTKPPEQKLWGFKNCNADNKT